MNVVGVIRDQGVHEVFRRGVEGEGGSAECADYALEMFEESLFDVETRLKDSFCQLARNLYVDLLLHLFCYNSYHTADSLTALAFFLVRMSIAMSLRTRYLQNGNVFWMLEATV